MNWRWPRATPLFAQVLWLVIATLAASQLAALVVILSLPPPALEVYSVADVAQAVRSQTATTREGRRLVRSLADAPPNPRCLR